MPIKKFSYTNKPLKYGAVDSALTAQVQDSIVQAITEGTIAFTNLQIDNAVINSTTIGSSSPGPGYFTYIQSGNAQGLGYPVYLYGDRAGDSFAWDPINSSTNINGSLNVRDASTFGNLILVGNNLESVTGNINLVPDGNGIVTVAAPLIQSTTTGNVSFSTASPTGTFSATSTSTATLSSTNRNTVISSGNGDVSITANNTNPFAITNITTGSTSAQVTTSNVNYYTTGESIRINGSNSVPSADGTYTVTSIIDSNNFTITPTVPITTAGSTGTTQPTNNVNLTGSNVILPYNTPLEFGGMCSYIVADTTSNLNIDACNRINLNTKVSVNIPTNIPLNIGTGPVNFNNPNSSGTIGGSFISDGTNVTLTTPGFFNINGNLLVTGTRSIVNTQELYTEDPIIYIGTGNTGNVPSSAYQGTIVNDGQDRGIAYDYGTGSLAKVGYFGWKRALNAFVYIPDATIVNNVVTGALGNAQFANLTVGGVAIGGGTGISSSNLTGNPDLTLTERNLFLTASGYIQIPNNIKLFYGSSYIYEDTNLNLDLVGNSGINLNPGTGNVSIPTGKFIYFNGSGSGPSISSSSTNLIENSSTEIDLVAPVTRIVQGNSLNFSTDNNSKISSNGNSLTLNSQTINLTPSTGSVIIPTNGNLQFGNTNNQLFQNNLGINLSSTQNTSISGSTGISLITNGVIALGNNVTIPSGNTLSYGNNSTISAVTGSDMTISNTTGNILLNPSGYLGLSKCLVFSAANINTSTESVCFTADRSLIHSALLDIRLYPTNGNLVLPIGKKLVFGVETSNIGSTGTATYTNKYLQASSTGILLNSDSLSTITGTTISLTASLKVSLPIGIPIQYGSITETILGNGSDIFINTGRQIILSPTTSVYISNNLPVQFSSSTESISGNSGVLKISANSQINMLATNTKFTDPILTLGGTSQLSTDPAVDTGIEYQWYNNITNSAKLGWFGNKKSIGKFTYIPDCVNNSEVISGAYGDAIFSNLELENATGVSTISSNNTLTLSTPVVNIPTGDQLQFGSANQYIYSDGTNLNISGLPGRVNLTSTNVTGSLTVNGQPITSGGGSGGGGTATTLEYVTVAAGNTTTTGIIDWTINQSYVTVTGSTGTATITVQAGVSGYIKNVMICSMNSGVSLALKFTGAQLSRVKDPVSGTSTSDSTLTFDKAGQNVMLIYDYVNSWYYIVGPNGILS